MVSWNQLHPGSTSLGGSMSINRFFWGRIESLDMSQSLFQNMYILHKILIILNLNSQKILRIFVLMSSPFNDLHVNAAINHCSQILRRCRKRIGGIPKNSLSYDSTVFHAMGFDSKYKSILVNLVSNLHDNIKLKLRTCFNWKKPLRISNHHEDWPRPHSLWVSPAIATGGKSGMVSPNLSWWSFQHTPGTYPRPSTNRLWWNSFHLQGGCLCSRSMLGFSWTKNTRQQKLYMLIIYKYISYMCLLRS